MKHKIKNTKLEVLTFLRNHIDQEYTERQLRKEFNLTQPAMWKVIRELWWSDWVIKNNSVFPTRYRFNELLLIFKE